jgi:trimethylamine--corrinoid protein Co-methyltransferase
MSLRIRILEKETIDQIIDEALGVLQDPGVRIHNAEALELLAEAKARVDREAQVAKIPEKLVRWALDRAPSDFDLYTLTGKPACHYGGDAVQFDPGSTALTVLDSENEEQRPPVTSDFVTFVKLVEVLPQLDAQSTAMICSDVPEEIGDLYRLYLALNYMCKPIVTGAFGKDTWWIMKEMLEVAVGGSEELASKPVAIFDVCPSPPLLWSDLTCQNLIDCARTGIPSELVSMPLAGAVAPVTLAGAVVQHTAECMSGVLISQLAQEGAPIVWGGSPAAFDMREGTPPMGDVGTWLIDCAYAEVGKALGMPTHAYLGMSDAKVVDAQCGLESAGGTIMAALAGINMVSGAGMLDFESCQSLEKLVIDAEIIGMTKRLVTGIEIREKPIALSLIREMGHRGEYLGHPHTMRWFQKELYFPSQILDRGSLDSWKSKGGKTAFERARDEVKSLVGEYEPSGLAPEVRDELRRIAERAADKYGMDKLPALPHE